MYPDPLWGTLDEICIELQGSSSIFQGCRPSWPYMRPARSHVAWRASAATPPVAMPLELDADFVPQCIDRVITSPGPSGGLESSNRPSELETVARKVAIFPLKIPTCQRSSGPSLTNLEVPRPALEPPWSNLPSWHLNRNSPEIKFSMETSTEILTLKLSTGDDFWGLASTFPKPKTKVVDNPKRRGLQVVGRPNSSGMAQGTQNTLIQRVPR